MALELTDSRLTAALFGELSATEARELSNELERSDMASEELRALSSTIAELSQYFAQERSRDLAAPQLLRVERAIAELDDTALFTNQFRDTRGRARRIAWRRTCVDVLKQRAWAQWTLVYTWFANPPVGAATVTACAAIAAALWVITAKEPQPLSQPFPTSVVLTSASEVDLSLRPEYTTRDAAHPSAPPVPVAAPISGQPDVAAAKAMKPTSRLRHAAQIPRNWSDSARVDLGGTKARTQDPSRGQRGQSGDAQAILASGPQQPQLAKGSTVRGTVTVECALDVAGRPSDCRILRGLTRTVDHAVLQMMRARRYTVARSELGKTPAQRFKFEINIP